MAALKGKITTVRSASEYVDGFERVTVKIDGLHGMFASFDIKNESGLRLDDEVVVTVTKVPSLAGRQLTGNDLKAEVPRG